MRISDWSSDVCSSDLPLDRMIARLYRSGLQVAAPQFRSWALAQLAQVLPCDGVLWGSGVLAEMRFHTVTVHGLPAAFPAQLESTSASNPILQIGRAHV